jgi:molybdopterin-guanine dinucleotide biosynthesis protein B
MGRKDMTRIIGITGWSGSGKTTLLRDLVPLLVAEGLRVSTVKHAHHNFDIDQPGKDSWHHRQAGAVQVLIASTHRWALMHELREAPEPDLGSLIARMDLVDLILIEGYKHDPHPKIEVWRPANGKPPIYPGDPSIVALATDAPPDDIRIPVLPIDDIAAAARFVQAHAVPLDQIDWTRINPGSAS